MIFASISFDQFICYGICILALLMWMAAKMLIQAAKDNPQVRDSLLEKGWNIAKEHIRKKYGG